MQRPAVFLQLGEVFDEHRLGQFRLARIQVGLAEEQTRGLDPVGRLHVAQFVLQIDGHREVGNRVFEITLGIGDLASQ